MGGLLDLGLGVSAQKGAFDPGATSVDVGIGSSVQGECHG